MKNFSFGDKICDAGDAADGIYLIVSGMVKIHYNPAINAQCISVSTAVKPYIYVNKNKKEYQCYSNKLVLDQLNGQVIQL